MPYVIGCAGLQCGDGGDLECLDIICGGYVGVLLLDFGLIYGGAPW